jgi:3-oxoacyl-[acyl-carrier protein] reductase
MNLTNKVAVITGAGRLNGVGAATAKLLAAQGVNLVLTCLKSQDQAEKVIRECRNLGVSAELFLGDLTQEKMCRDLFLFTQEKFGRVDIIVNCIGATKSAPYENLEKLNSEDFARLFSVNVTAVYLIAQVFQGLLKASGDGILINISSAAGMTGRGSSMAYAAAKGAENTLTLALAQALAPEVRVNAICPSFIDSSWWEEAFMGREEKYQGLIKTMKENNVLGRVLKPIDVAYTVLSMIQNPCMTGELIRLDAGAHLGRLNPK